MDECAICLDVRDDFFQLSCSHKFHLECISKLQKLECPMCRQVPTNLPDSIKEKILESTLSDAESEELSDESEEEFVLQFLVINTVIYAYQQKVHEVVRYLMDNNIPLECFPQDIDITDFPLETIKDELIRITTENYRNR